VTLLGTKYTVIGFRLEEGGAFVSVTLRDTITGKNFSLVSLAPGQLATWIAARDPLPRHAIKDQIFQMIGGEYR